MGKKGNKQARVIGSLLPEIIKRHVARQLVSDDPKPQEYQPYSDEMTTVALFADISGFTKLSESLAARGPIGCEELGFYLNKYLEMLGKCVISLISEGVLVDLVDLVVRLMPQCALSREVAVMS